MAGKPFKVVKYATDVTSEVNATNMLRLAVEQAQKVTSAARSEVIEIAGDQIEPPPDFGASVRRDFIRGMGKVGKAFVIILEPGRVFDVDEMAGLCESNFSALAA